MKPEERVVEKKTSESPSYPSILTRTDFTKACKDHPVLRELLECAKLLQWPGRMSLIGIVGEQVTRLPFCWLLDEGFVQVEPTGFRIQARAAGADVYVRLAAYGLDLYPLVEVNMNPSAAGTIQPDAAIYKFARLLDVANALMVVETRLKKFVERWPTLVGASAETAAAHARFVEIGTIARAEYLAAGGEK